MILLSRLLLAAVVLVLLAGTASAELTIEHRSGQISARVLQGEPPYEEFFSQLVDLPDDDIIDFEIVGGHESFRVLAGQQCHSFVSGDDLYVSIDLYTKVQRGVASDPWIGFGASWATLEFRPARASILLPNLVVSPDADHAQSFVSIWDLTTQERLVMMHDGSELPEIELAAGHVYQIVVSARSDIGSAEAFDPVEARSLFACRVEPEESVAVAAVTWTAVRSLFD